MRRLVLPVAALVGVALCAAALPTPGAPPAVAAVDPATAFDGDVVVTEADSGSRVTLGLGERLVVRLRSAHWTDPQASGGLWRDALLVDEHGADAVFEAVRVGAATVQAQTDESCFHYPSACGMPTQLWEVHVDVVQTPPPRPTPTAASPAPRPSPSPVQPDVTVTSADSGRAYDLVLGQTLAVELGSAGADVRWNAPRTDDRPLWRQRASSDAEGAYALFRALSAGHAKVSWVTDIRCVRAGECVSGQPLYSVDVRVRDPNAPPPPPPYCEVLSLGPLTASHTRITHGNRPTLRLRFAYRSPTPEAQCQEPTGLLRTTSWGGDEGTMGLAWRVPVAEGGGRTEVEHVYLTAPSVQTSYVARSGGLASNPVLIRVHRRVEIGSAVVSGGRAAFRGSVMPLYGGSVVGVAAIVDGRWTYLGQAPLDGAGRFAASVRAVPERAVYVLYASGGSGTLTGSRSRLLP